MKSKPNLLIAGLALAVVSISACKSMDRSSANSNGLSFSTAERVARGKYLVTLGGCTDCHTPKKITDQGPVDDMELYLAGHPANAELPPPPDISETPWSAATAGMTAWTGPWGISYGANITPDETTGIGIWSEEMFIQAIRTGKHMGSGREILPPMPWQAMSHMTDEDLGAVLAYLKTVPPRKNEVPRPIAPGGPIDLE